MYDCGRLTQRRHEVLCQGDTPSAYELLEAGFLSYFSARRAIHLAGIESHIDFAA